MAVVKEKMSSVFRGTTVSLLPTERTKPPTDISQYRMLLYGEAGIGKSSFFAEQRKTLFFQFELASSGLEIFRTPLLTEWTMVSAVIAALKGEKHDFKGIVFDTAAPAYERCLEGVCKELRIEHPSDMNDFGKTWKKVSDAFKNAFTQCAAMGLTVGAIAHEKLEEVESYSGQKYYRVVPDMSTKANLFFRENADIIGYYHRHKGESYIQIVGDDRVMAKANPEKHFRTPAGDRVVRVPAGKSAKEAAENFQKAFNNQQKETYGDLTKTQEVVDQVRQTMKRKKLK